MAMKHQRPKGTRDFFPADMAWRNHLHDAWKRVSVRNGFEQVDGPVYEHLDLYKVKSGDGIVSELFSFRRHDGETDYAIRPEFTPTLARMVAERANALPRPVKWFCVPNLCRAERHQRGRLREFFQWNCDVLGVEGALADAENLFTLVDFFREMRLTPAQVRLKVSHRETVRHILMRLGVPDELVNDAFNLLDRRGKMDEEEFAKQARLLRLSDHHLTRFDQVCRMKYPAGRLQALRDALGNEARLDDLEELDRQLHAFGIQDWCEYDLGIVRGLAYYTGTVFEAHEATGVERAIAGGGRYDRLIEAFGGPSMPAVGFGMGDVVLTLVLQDKGLIPAEVGPKPDVFVAALSDLGQRALPRVVADLRSAGVHARFSYKSTRQVGKLMKDADACGARHTLLLDDRMEQGLVSLKHMASGTQDDLPLGAVADRIRAPAGERAQAQGGPSAP